LHAILEESPSKDDSVSSEGESSSSSLLRACHMMTLATPIIATPLSKETLPFQTTPTRPHRTTTPTPLPEHWRLIRRNDGMPSRMTSSEDPHNIKTSSLVSEPMLRPN
jgi:hypothetical protein